MNTDSRDVERESLVSDAAAHPHQYDFFNLIRFLDAHSEQRLPTGYSERPIHEEIRFGNEPVPYFPTSTLSRIENQEADGEGGRERMNIVSYFMGLTGPNGPLPMRLTEFVYRRLHGIPDYEEDRQKAGATRSGTYHQDSTLSSFFNFLEHRPISLFFRAWADVRKTVDYDRSSGNRFDRFIGSLHGDGFSEEGQGEISLEARHFFAGHLGRQSRNPEGLREILTDYFGTPVTILENTGHWLNLPASSVSRLGESPNTGLLGETLVLGNRYWDCQLKYTVRLGPMRIREYERFFPVVDENGRIVEPIAKARRALIEWVRYYTGLEFFVDVQLVLRKEDVPEIELGTSGMLGYSCWLRDKPVTRNETGSIHWEPCPPMEKDADNLIFELELE